MKTVLFINSSGARCYRRVQGSWQLVEKPTPEDRLWVIANLPEETLEAFEVPLLFGRDRSHFIKRRLDAAFAHSLYRAAPIITGNWFKPGTALLNGLTTSEAVSSKLEQLDMPIAGVWGISMLLTLLARRESIANVMLVIPSVHFLRILIIKDGIPVITRCIHRYGDESEGDSDANEILRTRQHLENRRIFEHDAIPPLLYLGDTASVGPHLSRAGLTLLALPENFHPQGDAAYLHPLFELVASSPAGQLAPLQLRAHHLTRLLRETAFAGCAVSLLAALLFGQQDFRALVGLHAQERELQSRLRAATEQSERLAANIDSSGMNPAKVRQATKFSRLEMDTAPTPQDLLQFTALAVTGLPEVRIKNLSYRFPKSGERYCQGLIEVPLLGRAMGEQPDNAENQRYTELKFSILATASLPPAEQITLKKHISAQIKSQAQVQLMQDPAAFSLINTLKGGIGMDTNATDNIWCMSIPWKGALP